MSEYVCLTILARPAETEAAFAARLSRFWTRMLRERPSDFAKVYAEATSFEPAAGVLARQYLIEGVVAALLETELRAEGLAYLPIDLDETYSKYEGTPPEWMQIEH